MAIVGHSTLETSLISYWKMDEASGTRNDATATGNNLGANGTGGVGSDTGKIGTYAASIVRADQDYLQKASPTSYPTGNGARSESMWVKWTSLPQSGANTRFMFGSGTFSTNNELSWGIYWPSASTIYWYSDRYGSNNIGTVNLNSYIGTGTWYHVVHTWDGTDHKIYIDGTLRDTVAASSYNTGSGYVTVGARIGNNSPGESHDGLIDEVGWWSKVLTQSEVTDLYNSGAGLCYDCSSGGSNTSHRQGRLTLMGVG